MASREVRPLVDLQSSEFLSEEYKKLIRQVQENGESLPDLQIMDSHVNKRTEYPNGDPDCEAFPITPYASFDAKNLNRGVKHVFTALYSSQANASERVTGK
ncbi:unnamed protein product [Ceratitis capitata]|uniref:(Mediterranean fruit fly) hypothetical protein n=1 Tax=Ceratitis capitata TaxID=7213 RepID=A0A811UVN0_CERCA|nr:unnamed protein product [Ceratitis capitata]